MEWRRRMGAERAQEITTMAAGRGTRMHKYLEDYVNTDQLRPPGTNPYSIQSHVMAHEIITQGLSKVDEFWGMEVPVYYTGLYSGTSDCIGVWRGKPAIIDFKQSNRPKQRERIDDYFIQLTSYAMAHNNMHGTDIETGVILMCCPPDSPGAVPVYQEFVIEGDEFKRYSNLWWDRVAEYYQAQHKYQ
jgi:hypothetical protein